MAYGDLFLRDEFEGHMQSKHNEIWLESQNLTRQQKADYFKGQKVPDASLFRQLVDQLKNDEGYDARRARFAEREEQPVLNRQVITKPSFPKKSDKPYSLVSEHL